MCGKFWISVSLRVEVLVSLDALPWQVPTTAYTENMASLAGKTAETYPVTVLWPEFQLEACLGEEFVPPFTFS